MEYMARSYGILIRLTTLGLIWALLGCAPENMEVRATARPDIRITPAIAQDVPATATAYARQIIPTPIPEGLYIVKPGDTLSKIADELATTVDEIMAHNNLSDPNTIQVGQQLIIPAGVSFDTSQATPEPDSGNSAPESTATATP